jgi:predicted alpha-1,2-mannosidase
MKGLFLLLVFFAILQPAGYAQPKNYTQYVDPFIGTQHEGHTFPGATAPLGMVQASPESYNLYYKGYEMDHVAGYQYNDPLIWGFTQTHLNGVGCPSLSDILLMPYCGKEIDPSQRSNFASKYDKKNEKAYPGFYSVYLSDHHVKAELTAAKHAAYHRYKFDAPLTAQLLIDLQYGVSWDITTISANILEADQTFEDDFTLAGYRKAREWAERKLFYVIKFNKKIKERKLLSPPGNKDEKAPRYLLNFEMGNDSVLEVMIGLSAVSIEGANNNLQTEITGWGTFDKIKNETNEAWNNLLSKVKVEGSDEKKKAFYTSLYHMYIQPNNLADVNGKYRNENDSIYQSSTGRFYTTLSLWDTYRAANPFYTILTPDLVSDFISSMMDSYTHKPINISTPLEANKYLPRWGLWGKETHTMVGNHAIPVIVDAYLKGIRAGAGYTDEALFNAVYTSVAKPHYRNHAELIDKYGYIPNDVQLSAIDDSRETVSRLLEGCYDFYCAALFANSLGKLKDKDFLMSHAANYKNVYDKASGFMRGKDSAGQFKKNVDLTEVVGEWVAGSDFTEGNPWHYLFHVQHDVPAMIAMMGGEKKFSSKLDTMFCTNNKPAVKTLVWNIYGTIGQYWHGNEPCNHVPYLYKYTSEPFKTDEIIKYVVDSFYKTKPDGLKGNDDCGQMSAWYIFSVLGFYPVNPCNGQYILGAPQVPAASIVLPDGKYFTIKATGLSDKNHFVKKVLLNGKQLNRNYITHKEILAGGNLVFIMYPNPQFAGSSFLTQQ